MLNLSPVDNLNQLDRRSETLLEGGPAPKPLAPLDKHVIIDPPPTLSYEYLPKSLILAHDHSQRVTPLHRRGAGGEGFIWLRFGILLLYLILPSTLSTQDWTTNPWPASWITHPTAPATEFAVVNFCRTFELSALPDSLPVMVSADNRYQLFVNGQRVGEGPSRGDLLHWRYETYDLRPYIQEGKNVIAAIVWNYGIDKPWSQESYRLGFLLQPKTDAFADLKTDNKWLTYHNQAYSPILGSRERLGTYVVTGPQLRIDGSEMPWGWERQNYNDGDWLSAKTITNGSPAAGGTEIYWGLVERELPSGFRMSAIKPAKTWHNRIEKEIESTFVPPNSVDSFLIDYGKLTNAYFHLIGQFGKGAKVTISYAESLVNDKGQKVQRDEIKGKYLKGLYDEFLPEGAHFVQTTLWFRTARFVQIKVETGVEKFQLKTVYATPFAYPFKEVGSFTDPTNTHRTKEIWDVGWQTARMCAQETYVDCPYYEQLQYVGDTRIQALISLYVSGDDRLMRKAIKIFDESRIPEGLTQSRYPSKVPQVIPPYSLSWVEMVGDYWMHRPDTAFVRARLDGVSSVLNWYNQQLLPNGLIGSTPYWNFVDWTPDWPWNNETRIGGVPDLEEGSSILSLQYVSALRTGAELYRYFGDVSQANVYSYEADQIAGAVTRLCWNAKREMFSDTPKGEEFSQHANILALLTDLVPAAAPNIMLSGSGGIQAYREMLLNKILTDESLTQVSEYFRFYLIQALFHVGRADLYVDQLKVWEAYLDQGFTTFPEKPGETRSDCHAWSASPNYDLLATLAGIRPGSPGFETVSVTPASTNFSYEAVAAHPKGVIRVKSSGGDKDTHYEVELPAGVTGIFEMKGQEFSLKGGVNLVTIR